MLQKIDDMISKGSVATISAQCYNPLQNKPQRAERKFIRNKGELINAVAANGLTKKDAEAAINAVFGAIGDALAKGDSVQLIGFGTFGVKERAAREGRNPRTGEVVKIKASKVPTFKAGKGLKDKVAK